MSTKPDPNPNITRYYTSQGKCLRTSDHGPQVVRLGLGLGLGLGPRSVVIGPGRDTPHRICSGLRDSVSTPINDLFMPPDERRLMHLTIVKYCCGHAPLPFKSQVRMTADPSPLSLPRYDVIKPGLNRLIQTVVG